MSLGFAVESLKQEIEEEDPKISRSSPFETEMNSAPEMMDTDPFPLEKEIFPEMSNDVGQPLSKVEASGSETAALSRSASIKQKYEELSEESPEEGESED